MHNVERDVARILTVLQHTIHQRGFTQMEVEEALGWGQSDISQLVTRQKPLRVDQVHRILEVIGVEPEEFWAEVYGIGGPITTSDIN